MKDNETHIKRSCFQVNKWVQTTSETDSWEVNYGSIPEWNCLIANARFKNSITITVNNIPPPEDSGYNVIKILPRSFQTEAVI